MKKLTSAIVAAALCLTLFSPAHAENQDARTQLCGTAWTESDNIPKTRDLYISGHITLSESATLKNYLRIESGSVLEITNGAEVTLSSSRIFIEKGGTLLVTDGKLKLSDAYLQNNGAINIEKGGELNISSGGLTSYPQSVITCSGNLTCTKDRSIIPAFNAVRRYDSNFTLSDYSMHINITGGIKAKIQAFYCIDNIETNYCYTIYINKNKTVLRRSNKSLSAVYSPELREKLLSRVEAYEAEHPEPSDFPQGVERLHYYTYIYKTGELTEERWWFGSEAGDDPMIMELGDSTVIQNT